MAQWQIDMVGEYSGMVGRVQWVQWFSGTVANYSGMVIQWCSATVVEWYSGMVGSHQGSIRSQPQLRQCIDAYLEPAFTLPTRLSNTPTNPTQFEV